MSLPLVAAAPSRARRCTCRCWARQIRRATWWVPGCRAGEAGWNPHLLLVTPSPFQPGQPPGISHVSAGQGNSTGGPAWTLDAAGMKGGRLIFVGLLPYLRSGCALLPIHVLSACQRSVLSPSCASFIYRPLAQASASSSAEASCGCGTGP